MVSILPLFPIVTIVEELREETIDKIKLCSTIEAIKLLVEVHSILELTDKINKEYNDPLTDTLVYDKDALTEMRNHIRRIFIMNDPKRHNIMDYRNKVDRAIHYYKVLDERLRISLG